MPHNIISMPDLASTLVCPKCGRKSIPFHSCLPHIDQHCPRCKDQIMIKRPATQWEIVRRLTIPWFNSFK